jgi:hypothetical protein
MSSSSRRVGRSAGADRGSLASKGSTISLGREAVRGLLAGGRTRSVTYSKSSRKCLVVQVVSVAQPGDHSSRQKAKTLL